MESMDLGPEMWWVYVIVVLFLILTVVLTAFIIYISKLLNDMICVLNRLVKDKIEEPRKGKVEYDKKFKDLENDINHLNDKQRVQDRKIEILNHKVENSNSSIFTRSK